VPVCAEYAAPETGCRNDHDAAPTAYDAYADSFSFGYVLAQVAMCEHDVAPRGQLSDKPELWLSNLSNTVDRVRTMFNARTVDRSTGVAPLQESQPHDELLSALHRLILNCWKENPATRPSLHEICEQIEDLLGLVDGPLRIRVLAVSNIRIQLAHQYGNKIQKQWMLTDPVKSSDADPDPERQKSQMRERQAHYLAKEQLEMAEVMKKRIKMIPERTLHAFGEPAAGERGEAPGVGRPANRAPNPWGLAERPRGEFQFPSK